LEDPVAPDLPRKDPQDQAFGATAAKDQEIVDEFDDMGAGKEDLPTEREEVPRAAGKAEPEPPADR
jgi:hypothetical protein